MNEINVEGLSQKVLNEDDIQYIVWLCMMPHILYIFPLS